ncbi:MAG: hypothetical protein RI958_2669 [Actinomycetota bacterium]|jgi:LPXTG-motif cell wall-anchored protein
MKIKHLVAAAGVALAVATIAPTASAAESDPIATIAAGDAQFSTLVAAASAAGLVGAIDSCEDGPVTVFAPTNEAFAAALTKLGLTAEQLLADTATLTAVLKYHIVPGKVDAATVVGLTKATTLNGKDIAISVSGSSVTLNGSVNVVATDIMACNGIIHVIDGVLLPPADPTPGTMPETGVESGVLAAFAAGLLAIGALGVTTARRRPARIES